jgi:glycosyltransferase involved in cell wall biosynthesis
MRKRKKNYKTNKKEGRRPLSIFHGLVSAAGQTIQIARSQRSMGHVAHSVRIGQAKLGFQYDEVVPDSSVLSRLDLFHKYQNEFDVFHFYAFPFINWKKKLVYPFGYDLFMLKALGKTVIMNFRGSEVRQKDIFEQKSKFYFSDGEDHGLFKNFPSEEQRRYINFCNAFCTSIVVPDAELASYVPGSKIIPRAIDLSVWPFIGAVNHRRPLVIHAPTRRQVKGTDYVLSAVENLKNAGLEFDFQLIEGLRNDEARELYKKADIVVDQLRIGWHGVLALEAMALGKVVVCYIRDDLEKGLLHKGKMPLINATPDTINEVLHDLISKPTLRREIGHFARRYVEEIHDVDIVARQFVEEYYKKPQKITQEDVLLYQGVISGHHRSCLKSHKKTRRPLPIRILKKIARFLAYPFRSRKKSAASQ